MLQKLFVILILAACAAGEVRAEFEPLKVETTTGIDDHRGTQVDMDLKFNDENGRAVTLRDVVVPNRPFLLAPVYYSCPHLCTLTLNGLTDLLREIKLTLGKDFSVIAYSIKPEETADLASKKRANYLEALGKEIPGQEAWHFLTGSPESISKLSSQVGFRYVKDGDEIAHAAAILVMTPDGHISKYLYSVIYEAEATRKSLVDASEGRIGSIGERIFLFCFRYDHFSGKYTPIIMNIVRVVSAVMVAMLFGTLLLLRLREVRNLGKIA